MGQSAEELRRDIDYTRSDLGETLDAIGDRVSPGRMVERRKNRVRYSVQSIRERVMGTVGDTGQSFSDTRHNVTDSVTGTASGAVDTLKQTPDTVREQTQGSPLVAGAVAFGVGVLAASVFKPSSVEQRAAEQLMDKVEPLKDELRQTGQEVAEHLKEPAREAAEQVKETATQGTQNVTETAKGAAQSGKQAAQEATQNVRTEASGAGDGTH